MRTHRRGQKVRRSSKNIEREKKFFTWLLGFCSLAMLVIICSLGSRTIYKEKTFQFYLNEARDKIRSWEKNAKLLSPKQPSDARNHSSFHFLWNKKFSPPNWTIETTHNANRDYELQEVVNLSKAKITLKSISSGQYLYTLEEPLMKGSDAFIQKDILPLLPGERLLISFPPTNLSGRNWKIRLRSIGATQDRLDAPVNVNLGFSSDSASQIEISPKGKETDLNIPSSSEFSRREAKTFIIEWPIQASGLLVVEGFRLVSSDDTPASTASRTLIIHLDSLNESLEELSQTVTFLKTQKSSTAKSSQFYFSKVVPPANDFDLSQKTLMTWRNPVELGATVTNEKLRNSVSSEPLFLKRLSESGGAVRRLSLGERNSQCSASCAPDASPQSHDGEYFSSSLFIQRNQEITSTAQLFEKTEFFSAPGALFVDIKFPAEALRLNWTTALTSKNSLFKWIFAGFTEMFGTIDPKLKGLEKSAQIDNWITSLLKAFFTPKDTTNVAIFLHKKASTATHETQRQDENSLTVGESIFFFSDTHEDFNNQESLKVVSRDVSQLSLLRTFEKMIHPKEKSTTPGALFSAVDSESSFISQLNKNSLMSVTSQGWLIDQLHNDNNTNSKTVFNSSAEHVYEIQERSNAERRLWRLHGLHILLPNNNEKEEVISLSLGTDLHVIGCESETENAQLEPSPEINSEAVNNFRTFSVVGRRGLQSQWHLHCLLEGRITDSSRLKIVTHLNNQSIGRDKIGLGEFALPIRGFLWRSPETLELTGAQILDATLAVRPIDKDSARAISVAIWTDPIASGLSEARAVFTPESALAQKKSGAPQRTSSDRLSGK